MPHALRSDVLEGEPDAGNLPVRFGKRGGETEPCAVHGTPPRLFSTSSIVMMFVAGGFLWANLSEHPYWTRFTASKPLGPVDGASVSYGWPADCYIRLDEANVPPGVVPYNIGEFGLKYHDGAYYAQDAWGFWISINVVTAALGIVGTALVSEWLIRCREGRKP